VNEQPTTPRPEPPKGQGGVEEPVPSSAIAELRELEPDLALAVSIMVAVPSSAMRVEFMERLLKAIRAVVGEGK